MSTDDEDGTRLFSATTRIGIRLGRVSVPIDALSFDDAMSWVLDDKRRRWEVMVTPNLYHLRAVRDMPAYATRYDDAALSLADGWPVAWMASRASGRSVERIAGSDLFQALVEHSGNGRPLVLVGGAEGPELDRLLRECHRRGWQVLGEPAPRSELVDEAQRVDLVARVAEAGSGGVVVIGLGLPLQEELAYDIAGRPGTGAILCLGNSINFSSGVAQRAPRLIRTWRLEWAYRAFSEPRRLLIRYGKDFLALPSLIRMNSRTKRSPGAVVSGATTRRPG